MNALSTALVALGLRLGGSRRKASTVIEAALRGGYGYGPSQPAWMTDDVDSFVKHGYRENGVVYACVSLIARSAAGVPWLLKKRTADGEDAIEKPTDAPLSVRRLYDMVTGSPNPQETFSALVERMVTWKMVAGECPVELVRRGDDGPVIEMWAHDPRRMDVLVGDSAARPVRGYRFRAAAGASTFAASGRDATTLDPANVMHWRFFDPDNYWRGLSPVAAAARSVARHNAYGSWNTALAQNMGKVVGVLSFEQDPGDEGEAALTRRWREQHAGPAGAGRPLIIGGLKEFIATGMNPVDADWTKGEEQSAILAAIVLGVAPELVGIAGQKTYSNMQEARKALYTETVLPLLDSLRDELNAYVAASYGPEWHLDYDTQDVEALQPDMKLLTEWLGTAWWLTPNERREALKYSKSDDPTLDRIWAPVGLAPWEGVSTETPDPDADADAMIAEAEKAVRLLTAGDA